MAKGSQRKDQIWHRRKESEKPERREDKKDQWNEKRLLVRKQLHFFYYFALLEKCNYRGVWPLVGFFCLFFLCIFNELTQHVQAKSACNEWQIQGKNQLMEMKTFNNGRKKI